MKCNNMPEMLVAFLYNELEPAKAKSVKCHLADCNSCRKIFEELKESTAILKKWEDVHPNLNFVFVDEKQKRWQAILNQIRRLSPGKRFMYGIPAVALIILLVLSALNFNAGYDAGKLHLSFSILPRQQKAADIALLEQRLREKQKETLTRVSNMIIESENSQNSLMKLNMTRFTKYIELQRKKDLQMVGLGLEGLNQATEGRLKYTNRILDDLIHLTGYSMEKK